jgi:predicted Zn-dependent peptidase
MAFPADWASDDRQVGWETCGKHADMPAATVNYPIHELTLPNGLRVIVSPDPQAPAVAVNLWYHVGSADESPGASGLAHLFEHLMFAGSAHVGSGEHLAVLEAAGGSVNGTTTADRTNFFETVPPAALELALWLEADRMAGLTIDQLNLDTQREVVKEEKRQRYDNRPYGDLVELLLDLNFPETHPYHHPTIGSMADLDAADLRQVQAFFTRWYQPGNAVLTLVGPISPDHGFDLAARYFGWIPNAGSNAPARLEPLLPHQHAPRMVVHGRVPQDAVYLCWRVPPVTDDASYAVTTTLSVLADGQSSRLPRLLLRERNMVDAVNALDFSLARGTSLACISLRLRDGIDPRQASDLVLEQLVKLASQGPAERELARVQAGVDREWLSQLAPVDNRADEISAGLTLLDDPARINRELDLIHQVDAQRVADTAAQWLWPDSCAILEYRKEVD